MLSKKNTVTREHLAKSINKATVIKLSDAYSCVDKIINSMVKALVAKQVVKIRLFGSLRIRHKNARIGRNPKTKVETMIQQRDVVQFRIAPTLKKKINDNIVLISASKNSTKY